VEQGVAEGREDSARRVEASDVVVGRLYAVGGGRKRGRHDDLGRVRTEQKERQGERKIPIRCNTTLKELIEEGKKKGGKKERREGVLSQRKMRGKDWQVHSTACPALGPTFGVPHRRVRSIRL
jgi:hypothetical protein